MDENKKYEQAVRLVKKKHINIGNFQLQVGERNYLFSSYERYWNLYNYSPFAYGTDVNEGRLTKREWNLLVEVFL